MAEATAAFISYTFGEFFCRLPRRMRLSRLPLRLCPGSPLAGSKPEKRLAVSPLDRRREAFLSGIPRAIC
jgi:hypothetical protein